MHIFFAVFSSFMSVWGTPTCKYVSLYSGTFYEVGACDARVSSYSKKSWKYSCNDNQRIIKEEWNSNGVCSGTADATTDFTSRLHAYDCNINLPLCKDDQNAAVMSYVEMDSCSGGDGEYNPADGKYYAGTTSVKNWIVNECIVFENGKDSGMLSCHNNPYSSTWAMWFSSTTCSGVTPELHTRKGQGCADTPPTETHVDGKYRTFDRCTKPMTISGTQTWIYTNTTIAGSLIILLCLYIIFMCYIIGNRDNKARYSSVKNMDDRTST